MEYINELRKDALEYKRQTGRTTRMMVAAAAAAIAGQNVVVLFKDEHCARVWRDKFGSIPNLFIEPMKVNDDEINWQSQSLVGERASHSLFIDHDVYESTHRHLLKAWTKYDLPMDKIWENYQP